MPTPDFSSPIEPKHSRLKHPMPLTLGSEQSVKLYKRYFERSDNALYAATKVLQLQHQVSLH